MMVIALPAGAVVMVVQLREENLPVKVDWMDVPPAGPDPFHVWLLREGALLSRKKWHKKVSSFVP